MNRFHEQQHFRQRWLWLLLLGVSLPVVLVILYGLYRQLVLGKPFGSHPTGNTALIAWSAFTLAVLLGTLVLMAKARLEVTVTDDDLVIRFRPFHRKARRIALRDIAEARARTYNALTEYGGWGIRYGFAGMAYNVSGSEGVQLVLANGKRILIGSQRSRELESAIGATGPSPRA